jgi:hypothetical protein
VSSELVSHEFFIEKLRREHDLSAFDCGNQTLTIWLQKFAWTNQRADSARTYVAIRGIELGYYARPPGLCNMSRADCKRAGKSSHRRRSLAHKRLTFGRREETWKGSALRALKRVEEAAGIVGVRAVMVHAIDDAARQF